MKTRSKPLGSKYASSRLGFTIIELLIVMGITAVLATLGGATYYNAVKKDQLESSAKEIVARLEKAKTKAVNQEQGDYWGVHFEANANSNYSSYAIFKGVAARSDNLSDQKFLGNGVNFLSPDPNGITTMDVVFNKSTGTIKDNADYLISLSDGGSNTVSIYVKKDGLISLGTPAVLQLLGVPAQSSPSDGVVLGMVSTQTLSWASVSGAQKYRLQVANDINFNSLFYDGTIANTSYLVTGLQPYVTYYWRVNAYNPANGSSLWSATRTFATTTTPTAPRSFAIAAGDAQNTLTWLIPTTTGGPAITNYKIHWGTTTGSYPNVISVGNVTNYIHTGLTNGTTYYYKIAAVNALGEGTLTSEASATPQALPIPGTPVLATIYNNYIGSPFSISIPFTSQLTITGCQYSIDGGTTWTSANVSGALPNFNCAIQNVTATNGASLSIGMRATTSGGTSTPTYTTKTVDSIGPTVSDSWTNNWTATSPVVVNLTSVDNQYLNNAQFSDINSSYNPGWDTSLNLTYAPSTGFASGYNGGVSSPAIGYHAHINPTAGIDGTPCFEYIDKNCTYGFCHRWLGTSYSLGTAASRNWSAGTQITVTMDGKVDATGKPVSFGLYYTNLGGTTSFLSGQPQQTFSAINIWETKTYTFTLVGDIDVSKGISLYIYGQYGSEGTLWIDNVKLFTAGSGVATTKYCVDTANTCVPASGTIGTSTSVTCGAGTVCTQYVRYASWDNIGNAGNIYSKPVRQDSQLPTNPTLTATGGASQVVLNWTAATDAGSGLNTTTPYKVVFATGATAPANCSSGTVIYSGTAITYTHTGLTNGTQYSYRVCAIDAALNMSTGTTASATPVTITPGAVTVSPSSATYVAASGTIQTTFNSSVAITSCDYTINNGTNWAAGTVSGTLPNYNCTGSFASLTNGTNYTFNMRATNANGTVTATGVTLTADSVLPTAADNWTDVWTATTSLTVTITPTDSGSGVGTTKYCVDTANTCNPSLGSVGTSVSVTCGAGTVCTQYVRYATWDVAGNASAIYSKPVRQDSQAPTNPSLTATPGSGQIALSWTAATDSGSGLHSTTPYKVVFATGATAPANCSGTALYSGTATTYTHTGLTNGNTYSYRVCALDALSNTSTGATASAIAGNTLPTAGTLTATPSTASYIPGTVTTLTASFTSSVTISSCEYTLNGGTNWYAATLSGSVPNYTCTQSNITGFADGSSYTLNMRATNSAGTTTATALTRTGDTVAPTVTDNWTNNWTATSPVTVTLTPTDAKSGVAATKYCVDTANSCTPATTGTSVSVTCSAGSTCTQYVRYAAWDNVNNASAIFSETVRQDSQAPTDGTLTVTPGSYQNSLSWSGFSDAGSGLASTNTYKVVYANTATPSANCVDGQQIYLGTATSYSHTNLSGGTTYYYRVCAYDAMSNISAGATNSGVPTTTTTTTTQPAATWTLNAASGSTCSTVCSGLSKLCSGISTTSGGTGGYGDSTYEYYSTSCTVKTNGSCSTAMTKKQNVCAGNTAYWTYCKCDNTPSCTSSGGTCMKDLTTCQNYPGCPLDASGCAGVCCLPNC